MDFFNRYKKIFLILGFIAFTAFMGYMIFSLFLSNILSPNENVPSEETPIVDEGGLPKTDDGDNITDGENGDGGTLVENPDKENTDSDETAQKIDETANGGITKTELLSENPTIGATLGQNGDNLQYYDQNSEKFYRITPDGKTELLSDKTFHNVQDVTWAPKKEKAILEYPDGSNIVYDFEKEKQVTLPKQWEDFNFSPQGDQIVLKNIGVNTDNNWLVVSNDSGTQAKMVEFIGENEDTVYPSWSTNNQSIAMYKKGIDMDRQEIFFVGMNDENFKSLVIDGRGFQHKWSEKGDRLLYSVYSTRNDMKPKLWIANAQGEEIGSGKKDLMIETWAEKCVFAGEYDLYCAVPKSLETGAGLFPELAEKSVDDLYKINTQTGYKKLIAIPEKDLNISNLSLTKNGKTIFFTDTKTKEVYKIDVK